MLFWGRKQGEKGKVRGKINIVMKQEKYIPMTWDPVGGRE